MERMTEKKIGKRKVKVHRMEGLYPYVRLEDFMQVCKGLEEENKKLKSDLSECECSMHFENDEVGYRKRECKKLKEELEWYKKQYEHSMGEDNGKLTKGGYASFNEYGELMEEDTLQELRDIGEI